MIKLPKNRDTMWDTVDLDVGPGHVTFEQQSVTAITNWLLFIVFWEGVVPV